MSSSESSESKKQLQIESTSSLFSEEMVTIEVGTGPNMKRFLIHKALLCKRIDYFQKMFSHGFKETIENRVTFPEDDANAWGLIIDWVYRDEAYKFKLETITQNREEKHRMPTLVCIAIGLAEKYFISAFADQMMDLVVENNRIRKKYPGREMSEVAYSHTVPGSKLRRYLSRWLAMNSLRLSHGEGWDSSSLGRLCKMHPDVAIDVLQHLHEDYSDVNRGWTTPCDAPACDYHQHDNGTQCAFAEDQAAGCDPLFIDISSE